MSQMLTEPSSAAMRALAQVDLAELMGAVNAATSRMEASHAQLKAQVAKLTSDLGQARAQIERSRRLAALGEMAAGIAHEIRNPLGCILLYAGMIKQDLLQTHPAQAKLAEKIGAAGKVMEAIVTDVLTFSREFRIRTSAASSSDLLERALEACSHDGVPLWRSVEVRRQYDPSADRVEVDEGLIRQALTNIVRNAFEAMEDAGADRSHRLTLEINTRVVADASGTKRRCVVFSVADTGTGVTDEVVARMFNPFFTTRGAGTGLGLAIVHRIIDAHGGRVSVTNNPPGDAGAARGTTVEVILPERSESVAAGATSERSS
jgi:signal transduction histidine kinase